VARMNTAEAAPEVYKAFMAAEVAIRKGPLDATVRELVKIRASQMNGCLFCIDMHTGEARKHGETEQRIYNLDAWRESRLFTGAERAALAYVEAVTILDVHNVTDEIWAEVEKHFDEGERGGLVAISALINLWNRIAIPTRMQFDQA